MGCEIRFGNEFRAGNHAGSTTRESRGNETQFFFIHIVSALNITIIWGKKNDSRKKFKCMLRHFECSLTAVPNLLKPFTTKSSCYVMPKFRESHGVILLRVAVWNDKIRTAFISNLRRIYNDA